MALFFYQLLSRLSPLRTGGEKYQGNDGLKGHGQNPNNCKLSGCSLFYFFSSYLLYTLALLLLQPYVQFIVLLLVLNSLLYFFSNPPTCLQSIDILLSVSVYTVSLFLVLFCVSACMYFYSYPSEFFPVWCDELGYIASYNNIACNFLLHISPH